MSATACADGVPCQLVDGLGVIGTSVVSGGDTADAARLETRDGPLFAKWHRSPPPGLFAREAAGLDALRATRAVADNRSCNRTACTRERQN